jgi:hypothetical protein
VSPTTRAHVGSVRYGSLRRARQSQISSLWSLESPLPAPNSGDEAKAYWQSLLQ